MSPSWSKDMPNASQSKTEQKETYTHGHGKEIARALGARTAASHAAFFLPHLQSGMSLLDCGSGPGSITIDLAALVAPGEVIGIDMAENHLEIGRRNAKERGVSNIRFETANVYELPFTDNSFDAVFSHAVVEQLDDPLKALREQYRVLKPGGILAIRDADRAGELFWPQNDTLTDLLDLWNRVMQHNGADPFVGRRLRSLLNETGLKRIEASASYECSGTSESVQAAAEGASTYFSGIFAEQAIGLGWMDRSAIETIRTAWKAWGENPNAFLARSWCEAIGWKE
jgi:ubiquinone/menaquinone biosynthesis C-methylase UbiE